MPMQPFSQNLCDPDARPEKYPPPPPYPVVTISSIDLVNIQKSPEKRL
jgi:hypothetical protein